MTKRNHTHRYLLCSITLLLSACIGEDPNKETTPQQTSNPTPLSSNTTTTAQAPSTATNSKLGEKRPVYTVRTSHNAILHHYYTYYYAANNLPLEDRDKHDSQESIKDQLDKLPKWSVPSTRWTDQHGTETTYPEKEANARIANDQHASTLQLDGNIVLQNLDMDENTGIYIPGDYDNSTSLLVQRKLTMEGSSWIDVRGRMETGWLDMKHGSVIDLTNGFGLSILQKQKSIDYNRQTTPSGVFKIEPDGRVDLDESIITAHKVDLRGTLTANKSTLNLQTRRVKAGEPDLTDIQFSQNAPAPNEFSLLQAKDSDTPEHVLTINGPAHFYKGSEIRLFVGKGKVSTITLNYPFSATAINDSDKPTLEGKLTLSPTKGITTLENTEPNKPILIIKSNIGFQQTIAVDQLLSSTRFLRKTLTLQRKPIPSEDQLPKKAEGLFLKISDDSNALSGGFTTISPRLQPILHSALLANFKAEAQSLSSHRHLEKPHLITASTCHQRGNDRNQLYSIGVGHKLSLGKGGVSGYFKGIVHQTSTYHPFFAGVPNANVAFNILNYSAELQREYAINRLSITPSLGASYMLIPETVHQVAFHTLHSEMALTSRYVVSSDMHQLSIAALIKGTLQTQGLEISSSPICIQTAVSAQFRARNVHGHLELINPFQPTSEFGFKLSFHD